MAEELCGDSDTHREHLGVSQTKQAKKKKSRRPIDLEDIAGSISFALECISHDTHLFVVPFGTTDPWQYYPNYHRPVGASSTSQELPSRRYEDLPLQAIRRARPLSVGTPFSTSISPQLSAMRIGYSSSEQSNAMADTPPLTQCFVHLDVSPSSTATPSSTPDDTMPALAPCQKDRLGRVMIEPDWILFTSLRQYQIKPKRLEAVLNCASLHTGGAKTVGTIAREISGLEGIGSSRQAEALDGVQIAAMSAQIAKLISALAESKRRRVAEQESMSETVHQIKEQVMNLARRPTTSAPDDTDYESDEDDYVNVTPQFRSLDIYELLEILKRILKDFISL
uniref:Uncharacterized protein n=1 Tax=Solanum tuberosum TaxID=4113 RepID=M1ACT0_SOLTU